MKRPLIIIAIGIYCLLHDISCIHAYNHASETTIHSKNKISILEKLLHSLSSNKDWQESKDECAALGIYGFTLKEALEVRMLVQEKLAIINNPALLYAKPNAYGPEDEHIAHLPLYKYELILKNVLTKEEFESLKQKAYAAAQGNANKCLAYYKQALKKYKKTLKNIDACLKSMIQHQQNIKIKSV